MSNSTEQIIERDQQPDQIPAEPTESAITQPDAAQPKPSDQLVDELRNQLVAEQMKNIELKTALEQQKNQAAVERAATAARTPSTGLVNGGVAEAIRDKAVRACGGSALFHKLTVDQRLSAQGDARPVTPEEVQKARELFDGRHSQEASQLAAASPEAYNRLRRVWREVR